MSQLGGVTLKNSNGRRVKFQKARQLKSVGDIGHLAMVVQSQVSGGANSGKFDDD
jgi:hypothetical protein